MDVHPICTTIYFDWLLCHAYRSLETPLQPLPSDRKPVSIISEYF